MIACALTGSLSRLQANADSDCKRRTDLDDDIAALRGKLASIDEQRERTFDLLGKSGLAADFVGQKLNALEEERMLLVEAVAKKEKERDELSSQLSGFYESREQIKALIERLQRSAGDAVYKLRSQISSRLKSLVSEIFVAPLGSGPMTGKAITLEGNRIIVVEEQGDSKPVTKQHRRYFLVGFKDGALRAVVPKENEPLEFEHQVVASKELGILLMTPGKKSKQLIRRESRVNLYSPPSPQSSSNRKSKLGLG